MVETTSCLTCPASVRQVSGVGVGVGGMGLGLGVKVTVFVAAGGDVTVWVAGISFEVEQAESPRRSVTRAVLGIA